MLLRDIILTKDDFDFTKWEEVLATCDTRECNSYYMAFYAKAKEAEASGDTKKQQTFVLLGAITSLRLKLDSTEEPFAPMFVMSGSRSAALEDFSDEQFVLFKGLAPSISDPEVQARIADTVWVAKRDNISMAELAVSAYLQSSSVLEKPDDWLACADRIERAMQLATSLGNNRESFQKVVAHIEHTLDKYASHDSSLLLARLMALLQTYQKGDPTKYATLANKAATRAEAEHDWHRARAFLEVEARWHAVAKDSENERTTLVRASETYVGEASDALKREHIGYSLAAHSLQLAIESLRKIKGTRERREQLYQTLLEYQAKSVSEMGTLSKTVDFTESANRAREFVKGKTLSDALFSLALSSSSPKMSYLREQVQHLAKVAPLQHLLSSVTLDSAGKVIARNPGMFSNDPKDAEAAIRAEMFRYAMMFQLFHTLGVIEPARAQINLEHNVRVADLMPIVSNNPLVPPGREFIFARGLHAGMTGDFLLAIHLLIPQFENSARFLLCQNSAITSGMDSAGIQEDYDLNKMLYMPELAQVFSEDTIFDLKGLLVERFGSNFHYRTLFGINLLCHLKRDGNLNTFI